MPAVLMPARHTSLRRFASFKKRIRRAALVDEEGVGETSGQTVGSSFGEASLLAKAGPAEEKGFLRSVRIASGSQFHRPRRFDRPSKVQVKSGPDVFADALVPCR